MIMLGLALVFGSSAQENQTFSQRVSAIIHRPEYKHATFGIEIYSMDTEEPLFTLNAEKMFTPGSTTKLLTEGTALELLGKDYRFHTAIYRTGPIDSDHTVNGDLILVASGDPDLSGRIQPDGTLAFESEDHSYGGTPMTKVVPGDPLKVMREFADQIASKGIKKISGRVLVDTSLFPEGDRELGTGVVISPVSVNDNLLDLTVTPGAAANDPAGLAISPQTSYVKIVNKIVTSAVGSSFHVDNPAEVANPDGTYTVTLTGSTPVGGRSILISYAVSQPSRFAESELVACLREKGIVATLPAPNEKTDFGQYKGFYTPENTVAEHTSPPLSEEVRVTLKVSQNLHASMTPYILGAVLGKAKTNIDQAGFDLERSFLQKAGLDLSGASQADGAGGAGSAFFTPDFMVHYLSYMAKQKDAALFERALPILGRDGTLSDIQTNSPAAGHVFAKTGTFGSTDMLNNRLMLNGKGLAGYITTARGQHLGFALYVNHVELPLDNPNAVRDTAGQALGEIAAAAYLEPIDSQTLAPGQE
jgi:D-alanyl-D-alanine carboxypeptidase/D-alanyl-D-alanine-endopeptidase (penicillin-binding protein 4)